MDVHPIPTSWDDLFDGVASAEDWLKKRKTIRGRFLELMRMEAAPEVPADLQVKIEESWSCEDYTVKYLSYNVEKDERAYAYLAVPNGPAPAGGFPAVVCPHGTTNWGACRTMAIMPEPDDPHADKMNWYGLDYARILVRRGFATISPEHFCCGRRLPGEGPFETANFYRRHPDWSAAGKATFENSIATTVLAGQPGVNPDKIGALGHSLGGHGTFWLAAYDERIKCAVPCGSGGNFRENDRVLDWSRDHWYVYFPQLRGMLLAKQPLPCDMHEILALIAPRPCLQINAINDGPMLINGHRLMMHYKLTELYKMLGHPDKLAYLTFGDGHSIPAMAQALIVSWFERWLKDNGDAFLACDHNPAKLIKAQ